MKRSNHDLRQSCCPTSSPHAIGEARLREVRGGSSVIKPELQIVAAHDRETPVT